MCILLSVSSYSFEKRRPGCFYASYSALPLTVMLRAFLKMLLHGVLTRLMTVPRHFLRGKFSWFAFEKVRGSDLEASLRSGPWGQDALKPQDSRRLSSHSTCLFTCLVQVTLEWTAGPAREQSHERRHDGLENKAKPLGLRGLGGASVSDPLRAPAAVSRPHPAWRVGLVFPSQPP